MDGTPPLPSPLPAPTAAAPSTSEPVGGPNSLQLASENNDIIKIDEKVEDDGPKTSTKPNSEEKLLLVEEILGRNHSADPKSPSKSSEKIVTDNNLKNDLMKVDLDQNQRQEPSTPLLVKTLRFFITLASYDFIFLFSYYFSFDVLKLLF
jgi:hypothetical protein